MAHTFKAWMLEHARVTGDPVGDLISDTRSLHRAGKLPAHALQSATNLRMFVKHRHGAYAAVEAVSEARKRWQGGKRRRKPPSRSDRVRACLEQYGAQPRERVHEWLVANGWGVPQRVPAGVCEYQTAGRYWWCLPGGEW